ncbi:MAG: glycosyl hydrolase-related protein [Planctomycetota bacterium]|nr:glycosyl hydrolase-related protein [Planctomycetota bacterium]
MTSREYFGDWRNDKAKNMKQVYLLVSQHFDLVWRRPISRYRRIRRDVINTLLDLLKEYPELKFFLVQGLEVRDYLEDCPQRLKELKKFISQGRIEIATGGQTIIDLNLPSGESIVRNLYYARKYFQETFGYTPVSACLADTFGACGQVPQILKLSGLRSLTGIRFVHIDGRLQYGNYGAFYWQGQDKSRILAFNNAMGDLPFECLGPLYGWGVLEGYGPEYRRFIEGKAPDRTRRDVRAACEAIKELTGGVIPINVSGEEHLPRGEVIEALIEEGKKAGLAVHFATPAEYVDAVASDKKLPVLTEEQNPVFTGCYATRTRLKQLHRRLESRLQSAETLQSIRNISQGLESADLFREDWMQLALLQFHDSLGGCHTDESYRFLRKLANDLARSISAKAPQLGSGNCKTLFNPLPWERTELVPLPKGSKVAGQMCNRRRLGLVRLPALGCGKVGTDKTAAGTVGQYRLTATDSSWQVRHLPTKRNLFSRSSCAPVVLLRQDTGTLWAEQYSGKEMRQPVSRLAAQETGPLFDRLLFEGRIDSAGWPDFQSLSYQKEILVLADRILFRITVDFQGKGTEVVLFFPFRSAGPWRGLYSTPFAETQRQDYLEKLSRDETYSREKTVFGAVGSSYGSHAHGNWPALYYATLTDGKVGYTLANRGTAGTRIGRDGMYVTVLRSPTRWEVPCFPVKPSASSWDNGPCTFEFCLFTHPSKKIPRREAVAFSFPPLPVPEALSGNLPSPLLEIAPRNILFSCLKPCPSARQVILRLYESSGVAATARVRLSFPAKRIRRVDLNEENPERVNLEKVKFRPFEIVSLQIEY